MGSASDAGSGARPGDGCWSRNPDVVYRDLAPGEGGVLLHLHTGAYHGLNATAAVIWGLLDDAHTVDELLAGFAGEVADAPDDLPIAVAGFVADLARRDLIVGRP